MLREFVARRVSANDVEDIVQESLVRVWRRDGDAPIEHPKSYLIRIANAVIIDRARREGTRRKKMHCGLEERHHPNDPLSPHRIVLGREQLGIFMRGFEQLPGRTREILMAIRMDGQSFKAVAQHFGISVSAVEKVVSGALRALSEHLKEAERAQRIAASLQPRVPRPAVRRRQSVEHRADQ
jgi:RNA polymerase sigma-70 factor (ECF subfamily)